MLVDEQKELMRNLLFLSTNMAAMTQRENHLLCSPLIAVRFFFFPASVVFYKTFHLLSDRGSKVFQV